jgi:L-threonylcarbamoyladenylate synthase
MNKNEINTILEYLKMGKLIAFPTETVYGLGGDAMNDLAIEKIYDIKNRPINNPLIIHTYSIEMVEKIAIFNDDARKLSSLWPGPITFIMNQKPSLVSTKATSGLSTIGIRIPSDKIALEILKEFGGYIVAPSANPSGYISPTKFEHVFDHYSNCEEIYIVKGDSCLYGIESTIIDVSIEEPTILRHGFIDQGTIEEVLGKKLLATKNNLIKAPGMFYKHYAPLAKIRLNADNIEQNEIGIGFGNVNSSFQMNLSKKSDLVEAAANLYDFLRKADEIACKTNKSIAISPIPKNNLGIAINDKLIRAAQ